MRRTGGLLVMALALGAGVVGCSGSGSGDDRDRAALDTMAGLEKVPGVLVAPYDRSVQIDPAAPEDEIVATALGVRGIVDGLGENRPRDLTFMAVYPGDGAVTTEFSTRVFDDPERFERDVRIWAGLLDEGFTQVRYNVFDETGDGVLNVHSGEWGEPGFTVTESFDALVSALGDAADSRPQLQTEAVVGDVLATNRSGRPALPDGWADALDQVAGLQYLRKASAVFEAGGSSLRLTGPAALTAEQAAEVLAVLTGAGVLQPGVSVDHTSDADQSVTTLYGVTP